MYDGHVSGIVQLETGEDGLVPWVQFDEVITGYNLFCVCFDGLLKFYLASLNHFLN